MKSLARPWKWALFAAGCVGVVIFLFLQAGVFLSSPAQPPQKADLIVALGGDNGSRVAKAADLYMKGFAPWVLLTGLENSPVDPRIAYLNWRTRFLIKRGVPASAILFDKVSASSWDEAVNTLKLMQMQHMHRVLVVSNPPHLRRLHWVWSKAFAGSGKAFRLIAAPMRGWDATRWWKNEDSAQFVIMEYTKLAYYLIVH